MTNLPGAEPNANDPAAPPPAEPQNQWSQQLPQWQAPQPQKVSTYLPFSIVATVLFWPVGLAAILKSVAARRALAAQDIPRATAAGKSARTLAIIGTGVGAVWWLVSISVMVIVAVVAINAAPRTVSGPAYDASLADSSSVSVTMKLTVAGGKKAEYEFSGSLGGKTFENPVVDFQGTVTKTIKIDSADEGGWLDVEINSDHDVSLSCTLTIDGAEVSSDSGSYYTSCSTDDADSDDADSDATPGADDTATDTPAASGVRVNDLAVGDCFIVPSGSGATKVKTVDCAAAHDAEVFHTFEMTDDTVYPGKDAVRSAATEACAGDTFAAYIGAGDPDAYSLGYYGPSSITWLGKVRTVTCFLGAADDSSQLTGSARG